MSLERVLYAIWLILIIGFAALHLVNLRADFPNGSPWMEDGAKYTDEGYYGNAAIREVLTGHWQVPGDFTPAPAAPLWPVLEWVLFSFTGVSVESARTLVVLVFLSSLVTTHFLLRKQGPTWMVLLALTVLVTSPYLYCYSRLATLEPLLTSLTLASIALAVKLPRLRHPLWGSAGLGLLCTMLMLTKPTAIFVLPALLCACLQPSWEDRKFALRKALIAVGAFGVSFGLWMTFIVGLGLYPQYKYLYEMNKYPKVGSLWVLRALLDTFRAGLKIDTILVPLAILVILLVLVSGRLISARLLWSNTVLISSALVVAGYISFITFQNHPAFRYFPVLVVFLLLLLVQTTEILLRQDGWLRQMGTAALALIGVAVCFNAFRTVNYAIHPQYSFVNAAENLTHYIDANPNGNRLLVSSSSNDITLITHLPALCDPFGPQDLGSKLALYQPGWFATWNYIEPSTLGAIHRSFTLEQVASFHAFDREQRNLLVLFKLHPLSADESKAVAMMQPTLPFPQDRIEIPINAPESIHDSVTHQFTNLLRGYFHRIVR